MFIYKFAFVVYVVEISCVLNCPLGVKNLKVLDPETTLGDLGMDSLITVEIQQLLERKYQMSLTAKETRALTAGRILDINGSSD